MLRFFLKVMLLAGGCMSPDLLWAQEQSARQAVPSQLEENQKIAAFIEARLDLPGSDTAYFYLIQQIRTDCGDERECRYNRYETAVKVLERHGKYLAAIPLAETWLQLAESAGDQPTEVAALEQLLRLYNFAEYTTKLIVYRERLIALYEQMGHQAGVIANKAIILEGKAWDLKEPDKAMSGIEQLLVQATDLGLTNTTNRIRIRLKYLYEEFGHYEKLAGIVDALESIPFSDPLQPSEVSYAFHAASGRADLLLREKAYERAAELYWNALDIARSDEDAWAELYIIHRLARLETARQHFSLAKAYADEAFERAQNLNMIDQLEVNYKVKSELAEAEESYADALAYLKKFYEYRDRQDSIAPGFDLEAYYLQLEADQLKLEKERQALALQLRTNQLNYSLIVIILASLLAVGLFVGLYRQRKGKRKIAAQYALIQQQAEQLKQLDAVKSRFFANVSHELRTPLTLMLGPVKTLLHDHHPPERREKLLHMALQGGRQLQRLVNQILDLRKLEMEKMDVQPEPTNLASFFCRYAAQFESLAAHAGVSYVYETHIEKDLVAAIDREKCRQILHNLLSNAYKFTPPEGTVTARLCLNNELLTFEVADTGAGIHPDDLPRVFDRFFQSSRKNESAQGGTGIGLALCREYAQLFGGKMEVESTLGSGSTFRAVFPVRRLQDAVAVPEITDRIPPAISGSAALNSVAAAPKEKNRPTILVVEDNPQLQDYLCLILQEKYRVVLAGNGREALHALADTPDCQLILSDLMMPVMDGCQLLEKVKSEDRLRHLPFIILTARAEARDKLKALRIGVDDYLTKPFQEEELLARIANLLNNQAVRQRESTTEESPGHAAYTLPQEDQEWLERFEQYVQENLDNDVLKISFLAQEFAMSESTFLRQVTRLSGLSPKQYLQEVRLDAARQLLEARAFRTVSEVAAKTGYSNVRTFSRGFRERFGTSPSSYLQD